MLSSAIPDHLQCPRTQPSRLPNSEFQPPYPAYSTRFSQDISQLVIAIIGAQHKPHSDTATETSISTLSGFLTASTATTPPSFFEFATATDNKGFQNIAALAYWPNKPAYETWASESGFQTWWRPLQPEALQNGWFLEVFFPTMDRFETLLNTESNLEGSAHMGQSVSGPVQEHGYWGSMRDRLPLSQTDALVGSKREDEDGIKLPTTAGGRVIVPGKKNLAVIRSGQDWSATTPAERKLYLEAMHPVLTRGMEFLRDHGEEVGCYSCRFMEIVDAKTGKTEGQGIDRTFGLAYFDELASLEAWSREHPTHLAIFGGFHKYAKTLGNEVSLRVFHEVAVLDEDQQYFEYVGCHDATGMLARR